MFVFDSTFEIRFRVAASAAFADGKYLDACGLFLYRVRFQS